MRTIAELTILLRAQVELPTNLRLATDEFCEGWEFVRTGGVGRIERKIQARGWSFIKIEDGLLRSGVGPTSQEAIANALRLVLRRVSAHFNAVELKTIEVTQYPWFFLARVMMCPYRIQQHPVAPVTDEAPPYPILARARPLQVGAADLFPLLGGAMLARKKMPGASRSLGSRIA
jgi:hypothetical protein